MLQQLFKSAVVNPRIEPKASVIWLHGLGADGHDFEPIVPELHLPAELGVRFVFPHAPLRSVTINNGYQMPAWFDIFGLSVEAPQDEIGIRKTQQSIEAQIAHEISLGIPSKRIVLAGFSQGGAMALHCGLRYSKPLAGILALSTFLPLADKLPLEISAANHKVPIMMMHGTLDSIVPIQLGEISCEILKKLQCSITWKTYPMQHQVCLEQIRDIGRWLQEVFA